MERKLMILGAKKMLAEITQDENVLCELEAAVQELEEEICPELLRIGLETFMDATTRSGY